MVNDQILIKEMCLAGREYLTAGATITPGCLVERNSAGLVVPHQLPGGPAQRMFAIEPLPLKIDQNYLLDEAVACKICRAGDQLYAFLADGESTSIGDFLCSAGNGVFKKHDVTHTDNLLALALETVVAEGDTRIVIEII